MSTGYFPQQNILPFKNINENLPPKLLSMPAVSLD
jgi:hypothetical protein